MRICTASIAFGCVSALAAHAAPIAEHERTHEHTEEWALVLIPSAHIRAAVGDTDGDAEAIAVAGHDPTRENGTVQGIELGLALEMPEHLEGFIGAVLAYGAGEEWEDELEEAYLTLVDLPGNLELRAGRLLNRFGARNGQHQHSWQFVDQTLVNGIFLGDDGLVTDGADLTWYPEGAQALAATRSYGAAPSHNHGHDGDHGRAHRHQGEADALSFEDEFLGANVSVQLARSDSTHFVFGGALAAGENGLGGDTLVAGLNGRYIWREKAQAPGGRQFTWTTEAFLRDFDVAENHEDREHGHEDGHGDEEDEHSDFDGDQEFGCYTEAVFDTGGRIDAGLRIGYVEGVEPVGLEERVRISPRATIFLTEDRTASLRLQYNFDDLDDGGEAHSFWAQIGFDWGGHHGHRCGRTCR